jgi:hypothetical protein
MSDQREPFGRRRKLGDPPSRRTESTTTEGDFSSSPDLGPGAKDLAIKAVSGLLSSNKDALARPSSQPPFPMADLSGSLGELARRLKKPEDLRAKIEMPGISLDHPYVKFPDPVEKERSMAVEAAPDQPSPAGTASGSHPAAQAVSGPDSPTVSREVSPSHVGTTIEPDRGVSQGSHSPKDDDVSDSRLPVPISHSIEREASIEPSGQGDHSIARVARMVDGAAPRADSGRVNNGERTARQSETVAISGTSAVDRLREPDSPKDSGPPRPSEEIGSSGPSPAIRGGDRTDSARSLDSSASSVRNPLSADLRNFSMANLAGPDNGGTASGLGDAGASQAEPSVGSSPSMSEGGAIDLSRTNELLQQLVDAVRKQRSSSLPVGGPSVYSDR